MSDDRYFRDYQAHDRVPVQGDGAWWLAEDDPRRAGTHPPGTVEWWEHLQAWLDYDRQYPGQPAHVVAGRGGFGYGEITEHLGREPVTWKPNR